MFPTRFLLLFFGLVLQLDDANNQVAAIGELSLAQRVPSVIATKAEYEALQAQPTERLIHPQPDILVSSISFLLMGLVTSWMSLAM